MTLPHTPLFRRVGGVMIFRPDGKLLILEDAQKPGQWECPQGGLKDGESVKDGALREMFEETGIPPNKLKKITEVPFSGQYIWSREKRFEYAKEKGIAPDTIGVDLTLLIAVLPPKVPVDVTQAADREFISHKWMRFSQAKKLIKPHKYRIYGEALAWYRNEK